MITSFKFKAHQITRKWFSLTLSYTTSFPVHLVCGIVTRMILSAMLMRLGSCREWGLLMNFDIPVSSHPKIFVWRSGCMGKSLENRYFLVTPPRGMAARAEPWPPRRWPPNFAQGILVAVPVEQCRFPDFYASAYLQIWFGDTFKVVVICSV